MANKDRHVVLLVLNHWDNAKKPGTGFELRVVHVISPENKSRGAGVEKVYFYDEGRKSIPKVLQGKDLNKIWERKADIKALFDNPGPVPELPTPEPVAGGLEGGGLGGGGLGGGTL